MTKRMKETLRMLSFSLMVVSMGAMACQSTHGSMEEVRNTSIAHLADSYGDKRSFLDVYTEIRQIPLANDTGFTLSALPWFSARNEQGDFIVLDNFGVRQILVFDSEGRSKAKIGSLGTNADQYLYPDNLYYSDQTRRYYVYDGDLLRIQEYNDDFTFNSNIDLPLYLGQMIVTADDRFFCYTSGVASRKGADRVVYECTRSGDIKNSFADQYEEFSTAGESRGGGIVLLGSHLYVITPYEYELRKYDLGGKLIRTVRGRSSHYVPPPTDFDEREISSDLRKRQAYHATWSHIRQLLKIGDEMIGVVLAEPNERRVFLDLYDTDLNYVTGDLQLPEHIGGGSQGIVSRGDRLYLLRSEEPVVLSRDVKNLPNPTVVVYELKNPG